MLKKKETFIITINSKKELRLVNVNNNLVINRVELDKDVISYNKIDFIKFSYVLNKILSDVKTNDNILIRNSSNDNIFRSKEVKGIKEKDLLGFLKYNIEDLFPFPKENLMIKSEINKDIVLIYGMNLHLANALKENIFEFGLKSVYLTIFPSEFIAFLNKNFVEELLYLNIESNYLEYCIARNNFFSMYRLICLDRLNFDDCDSPSTSLINQIHGVLKEIYSEFDFLNNVKIFAIGDINLINVWDRISLQYFGKSIKFREFDVIKYFERK